MATTTNFGWETPDDTDLVKDGALAMRTLGNAIDASLVDLKGGTTGQVLSKNSNTDMDFTWVTSDDANAIQNAIVDAKGDLITATAADTPSRIAVGNNGETLVADSSASTGLRWQEPKAGNPVINSAFQIWQRGTSISVPASSGVTYTADRWATSTGANQAITVSRQLTGDTTNLPNIQYAARLQRNSGQTGTGALQLANAFETINSIPFVGKTVTLSFYGRAGANFSASSNILSSAIVSGTGTDQNMNGYTGGATVAGVNHTLTTTWQRFSITGTVSTSANEIYVTFYYTPTGTAGAADYFEITGVQLEVGSIATPFKTYAATLAGELAACQRYYQVVAGLAADAETVPYGTFTSASVARLVYYLPVQLRTNSPSITFPTGTFTNFIEEVGTAFRTPTGFSATTLKAKTVAFEATGMSGGTAGRLAGWNTTSTITVSAEL